MIALVNEAGTVVERYAYDPWGRRRNPDDWTQFDDRTDLIVNRGYTGHEHLSPCGGAGEGFGVINMNGRVYDPLTAQFYSPDPFITYPGDWLNYNRYLYAMGNPFKYSDPSGENPLILIAFFALHQGMMSYMQGGNFWKGAAIGAFSGLLGYGVGSAVTGLFGTSFGFLPAFTSSFAGGFAGSAVNTWLSGGSLGDGLKAGLISGGIGGLIGGLTNGFDAVAHQGNFWTGKGIRFEQTAGTAAGKTIMSESEYAAYRGRNTWDGVNLDDELCQTRYKKLFNISEGDFGIDELTTYKGGYKITTDGIFVNKDNDLVNGVTFPISRGHTIIRISPAVVNELNDFIFKATAGHELIHAFHLFNYGGRPMTLDEFKSLSEPLAYDYSDLMYMRSGGLKMWVNSFTSRPSQFYGSSNFKLTNEQYQHLFFGGF